MKVHELLKNFGGWNYVQIFCGGQNLTKDGMTSLRNIIAGLESRQHLITAVMMYNVVAFDRVKKTIYCKPPEEEQAQVA